VVSQYCLEHNIVLPIQKILMAGAPVSGELINRVKQIMAPGGEVHTPYGATESLPIASLDGTTIIEETWPKTMQGQGVCVGQPLPGITIEIMAPVNGPLPDKSEAVILKPGEIGEIIVSGPVVTQGYDHNDNETWLAKMHDDGLWHRMGDMGYLDDQGRLWFCGRKGHRVLTRTGELNTICCEGVFNIHNDVFRTALVGVGEAGSEIPVLCVECHSEDADHDLIRKDLLGIAASHDLTAGIQIVLFHPAFPVDIRHNAKIFREKLKLWATEILADEGTHS
jgi:acyl-CoA synthetase (AMP-forming)/AMP-acid ligase II